MSPSEKYVVTYLCSSDTNQTGAGITQQCVRRHIVKKDTTSIQNMFSFQSSRITDRVGPDRVVADRLDTDLIGSDRIDLCQLVSDRSRAN